MKRFYATEAGITGICGMVVRRTEHRTISAVPLKHINNRVCGCVGACVCARVRACASIHTYMPEILDTPGPGVTGACELSNVGAGN